MNSLIMLSNKCQTFGNPVIFQKFGKVFIRNVVFQYQKPKPITPCTRALKHYDEYYKSIFQHKWPSIRLGLLLPEKNVAVVNNFSNVEATKELLEAQGAFELKSFLEVQKNFINESSEEPKRHKRKEFSCDDAIQKQLHTTRERELNEVYSADKDVTFKAKPFAEEENSNQSGEGSVYDPEDATTSMQHDISAAKIDNCRMITPNSDIELSLLHDFIPATKLRGLESYISETEYFKYYKNKTDLKIDIQEVKTLNFPENIIIYTFDRGDTTTFPKPSRDSNNIFNYLLTNGSDLLTVLALNLKPGDNVLSMMPSSGNPAFCILQALKAKLLTCPQGNKIENLFQNYLHEYSPNWKNLLTIRNVEWKFCYEKFDKVLLDIDCTNDRESISNPENNYFAPIMTTERLLLPGSQAETLKTALKLVRKGGTVVYTTQTLCPVQNDGVVGQALEGAWKESKIEFCVKDLSPALAHTSLLFRYARSVGVKYGTLVLPFLPSNFGPRYFAKLVRTD